MHDTQRISKVQGLSPNGTISSPLVQDLSTNETSSLPTSKDFGKSNMEVGEKDSDTIVVDIEKSIQKSSFEKDQDFPINVSLQSFLSYKKKFTNEPEKKRHRLEEGDAKTITEEGDPNERERPDVEREKLSQEVGEKYVDFVINGIEKWIQQTTCAKVQESPIDVTLQGFLSSKKKRTS
ncbi:hypothetical protein GOP47_0031057 [Adiantum capillus-veneris]|nr:hypothetical protein GOP47_0031057 [Adiantum capillus-veneris]